MIASICFRTPHLTLIRRILASVAEWLLQIPNQLHFFTKIRDFSHARCKNSLLNVKNLLVD
jgi:hypothetical protein